MERSKMDMINDLYALRAGLSAISQEKDNLSQCCREANEEYDQTMNAEYNRYVANFVSTHDVPNSNWLNDHLTAAKVWGTNTYNSDGTNKANYYDARYEQAYQLQKLTQNCEKEKQELKEDKRYAGLCGFLCALFTAGTIAKILTTVLVYDHPEGKIGFAVLSGLCGIISIVTLIITISYNRDFKRQKKLLNYYIEMIALYPQWKRDVAGIISRVDAQMNARLQARMEPILNKAYNLYVSLQEEFALLLDVRDWKHLDLVIFYLETGRADTKKESLQLVEREVQTERIANAIKTAAAQICMTINMAAARITSRLDTLSAQLTYIAVERHLHLALDRRLIESIEMKNALLAKANMDSENLMKEAEEILRICNK